MIESYKVTRKLHKTQKCRSCVTKISCTTIGSLLSRQTIRIMGSVQDIIQFDHCSKPTDLTKNGSIRFQKVTALTAIARPCPEMLNADCKQTAAKEVYNLQLIKL